MISSASVQQRSQMKSKLALDFAVAALRAGDSNEAQRLLRQRLLEDPRDAAALSKLSEMAIAERRIEEATILLRRAADAEPTLERCLAIARHLHEFAGPGAALYE